MSVDVKLKFDGGAELEAAFRELPFSIAKTATANAIKSLAAPMVDDMKAAAPKHTGEGAASIAASVTDVPGQLVTVAVGPDRDHFYMAFIEWGTARQPARPFMRPAWDRNKEQALVTFNDELITAVERAAERRARRLARLGA